MLNVYHLARPLLYKRIAKIKTSVNVSSFFMHDKLSIGEAAKLHVVAMVTVEAKRWSQTSGRTFRRRKLKKKHLRIIIKMKRQTAKMTPAIMQKLTKCSMTTLATVIIGTSSGDRTITMFSEDAVKDVEGASLTEKLLHGSICSQVSCHAKKI